MAIKFDTFTQSGGGAGSDTLNDVTSRGASTTNAITVGGLSVGSAYTMPTSDGTANQVLSTSGTGTISFTTLNITGGLEYKGAFNATAGTPSIASALQGDFYIIDTAGTIYGQTWAVGDHLLINADMGGSVTNSKIDKIDNTDAVTSVNTLTGAVVVSGNDIVADHTAVNYTAADANVDGHLSGIDTKFGTLGTASVEAVGTTAGNVVQLDGSSRLPAVDGSLLTNLPSSGGGFTYSAITADPADAQANYHYSCGAGDQTFTVTLPTSGISAGAEIRIKNMGTGIITIDPQTRTIDGVTTDYVLDVQYSAITLVSTSSNWEII